MKLVEVMTLRLACRLGYSSRVMSGEKGKEGERITAVDEGNSIEQTLFFHSQRLYVEIPS